MSDDIKVGDQIVFRPLSRHEDDVRGLVVDIVHNQASEVGWNVLVPQGSDTGRILRVWSNRGSAYLLLG
jgi:hypothetical protein